MAKTQQAGQTRRRWAALLGLGLTCATGCSSTPMASAPPADPLHGVMVPPGLQQPANAPKADAGLVPPAPQALNSGGVPALPTSFSSSNPATLAGSTGQGSLGGLGDNGPPFLPGQANTGNRTQPGANATPKVERVPDSTPTGQPTTPTTPTISLQPTQPIVQPVGASQPTGDDVWSKQLEARGVINQTQERVPEGVRLTCYVSRGPGFGLRIVEWTALDYPTAAQAILQALATQP